MNYRNIFVLLAFIVGSLCITSKAQKINDVMFRQTSKYTFNLPQLDVCLSLPKDAGFRVPIASGKSADLDIGEQTYYCFGIQEGKNIFRFSLTPNDKDYIQLQIIKIPPGFKELEYRAKVKQAPNFRGILDPVKAKIGELYSYKLSSSDKFFYVFNIEDRGYFYQFVVEASLFDENKAKFTDFLKSFSKKDLSIALNRYNTRLNSGYYDKEAKKRPDIDPENLFETKDGKFLSETNLDIELYNTSFWLPAETNYSMKSRKISLSDNGNTQVEIYEPDTINHTYFARYVHKGLIYDFRCSSYDFRDGLAPESGGKNYIKQTINLDGAEAAFVYNGSDYSGSILISLKINNLFYYFSFMEFTYRDVKNISKIVASIKLPEYANRTAKNKPVSVENLISLKETPQLPLANFPLRKCTSSDYGIQFKLNFTDAGISMVVPGMMKDYLIRPETNLTTISDTECSLSGYPTLMGGWFGATSGPVCATLEFSKFKNPEEYLNSWYWALDSRKNTTKVIPYIKKINGKEWAIITYENSSGSNFSAYAAYVMPECTVFFLIESTNKEARDKLCNLIQLVTFNK